ncbi:hypothetical protein WI36_24140 [Burkholderia ubonensis]|uniref:hypothetical protein n=1 Tax=Burkholderia ubonensis TaxID=101571 RepID=UPI00075D100A|nr:hypothetical protein [Burkholderia ubonensis]KUZ66860.1 hypothetical protein WI36_24140 [Burkholderia ubonensis]
MNVQLEFSMTEAARILAEHMGAESAESWSFSVADGEPVIRICAIERPPSFPEHAPRSSPDYAAAMWAGIEKSEVIREVLAAVEQKRAEGREAALRAAERQLQPLGTFAVGVIMAALREVTR